MTRSTARPTAQRVFSVRLSRLSHGQSGREISKATILAYDRLVIWLETVGCERDGTAVLTEVTFGIARGELVVIEGGTASGKSTLLEIVAMRRLPDRGTVWIGGRNTLALQRSSLPYVRRNIGYSAPTALLIPDYSVLANVALAMAVRGWSPAHAEAAARNALTLVAADELADRRPGSLSSGQQGLVSLARAIVGPPPVVVVDEPAALTDQATRQRIVAALAAVRAAGSAVLCGTAEASIATQLAEQSGQIIRLVGGRILARPIALVRGLTPGPAEAARTDLCAIPDLAITARGPG